MKRLNAFGLVFAVAMTVAACNTPLGTAAGVAVGGPATVANRTVADEKAMIAAEQAFRTVETLLGAAVDAGALKGANAAKAKALNDKAHAALLAARRAYSAGNATNMFAAITEAQQAIGQIGSLVGSAPH